MERTKPVSGSHSENISEPTCPICGGCGIVYPLMENGQPDYSRTVPCECQREIIEKKRQSAMLRYCNLPARNMTFENFIADSKDLQEALSAAQEVADPNGKIKWLVLMGRVDRGKSHLAVSICREYLNLQLPAKYVFVPEMLDELRNGQFAQNNSSEEYSFKSLMHLYKTVPMLVLDDIGAGTATTWTVEKLTTIINSRSENNLPLVVTMNKKLNEIPGDEHGRIGSRLRRNAVIVGIDDAPEFSLRVSK